MEEPSGDQRGVESGSALVEILRSVPPSAAITQTSVLRLKSNSLPVRSETKAISLPSGDQRGLELEYGDAVSWRGKALPSAGTSQMAETRRLRSLSTRLRTKATCFPSGESLGSATNWKR